MEMTQKEFGVFSKDCDRKDGWKCKNTGYACKDYMCDKLKEDNKKIEKPKRVIRNNICHKCNTDMAIQILAKVKKLSKCPRCHREL